MTESSTRSGSARTNQARATAMWPPAGRDSRARPTRGGWSMEMKVEAGLLASNALDRVTAGHHADLGALLGHALLNSPRWHAEELLPTRLCALDIRSSFGARNFIVVVACRRARPRSVQADGLRRLAPERLAELEL